MRRTTSLRIAVLAIVSASFVSRAAALGQGEQEFGDSAYLIEPNAEWHYFEGTEEPSEPRELWRQLDFDDTHWQEGFAGFGDDYPAEAWTVIQPMQGVYSTLYLRNVFRVDDLAAIPGLTLSVFYDDGFVAYLNGHEVARSPTLPAEDVDFPYSAVGGVQHEAYEHEAFPIDTSFLVSGENVLAIQGLNANVFSGDFILDPHLESTVCAPLFENLECGVRAPENVVELSWPSGEYDGFVVRRNGLEIAGSPFPAGTASAVDTMPGERDNLYTVTALIGDIECRTQSCELSCADRFPDALACTAQRGRNDVEIEMTWPPREGVERIELKRGPITLATLPGDASRHVVSAPSSTQFVFLKAEFHYEDGGLCELRCRVDLCPTDLTCEATSNDEGVGIQLSWSNMVREWDHVTLRRDLGDGPRPIAILDDDTLSYFDEGVSPLTDSPIDYTLNLRKDAVELLTCSLSCRIEPLGAPRFRRGDANGDAEVNLSDGIFLLTFLFLGGPRPECRDASDVDDGGSLNLNDSIALFNYLFLGGPAPAQPGPSECGDDGTFDGFGCVSFPPCE